MGFVDLMSRSPKSAAPPITDTDSNYVVATISSIKNNFIRHLNKRGTICPKYTRKTKDHSMRSSNTNDTAKNLKSKEQANCSNLKATLTRDRAINKMEQCRRSNNISLDQNNCSKRDRSINKMEQCRRSNNKTMDQKHCSTNSANRDLGLINTNLEQTNCSIQRNNYVIPMIQSNCSVQNKSVPTEIT